MKKKKKEKEKKRQIPHLQNIPEKTHKFRAEDMLCCGRDKGLTSSSEQIFHTLFARHFNCGYPGCCICQLLENCPTNRTDR